MNINKIAYLQKKDKRLEIKMDKLISKVDKLAEQRKLIKKEIYKEVDGIEVKSSKQNKSNDVWNTNICVGIDKSDNNSDREAVSEYHM